MPSGERVYGVAGAHESIVDHTGLGGGPTTLGEWGAKGLGDREVGVTPVMAPVALGGYGDAGWSGGRLHRAGA